MGSYSGCVGSIRRGGAEESQSQRGCMLVGHEMRKALTLLQLDLSV